MAIVRDSIEVPYRDPVVEPTGLLSQIWISFYRALFDRVYPLGVERQFSLVNNQATPADITDLKVNSRAVSQATVDFLVQRVTTGVGAVELIESGSFILTYNPTAEDWNISLTNINSPDNSGVDFTVTASGQVRYTSSNETGTASISRVVWRMRTLAGKSSQYSSSGAR
jgi:hypothetical protein